MTAITFGVFCPAMALASVVDSKMIYQNLSNWGHLGADKKQDFVIGVTAPAMQDDNFFRSGDQAMNTIVEQIIRTFALAVVPSCIIDQQDRPKLSKLRRR